MLVLKLHDEKNPGKMSQRDYFKLAVRSLVVLGHEEGKENILHSEVEKEEGKYRSMKSCDENLSDKVRIIGKIMNRKRHLHLRQPGGNLKNGKNHMRTASMIRQSFYKILAQSFFFFFFFFKHFACECRARDGVSRQNTSPYAQDATQTHIFLVF